MGKSILVLEDEKNVAKLYEKSLKKFGYLPIIAFDGVQGLEKLQIIQPDLILLDLVMPNMNGFEFYHHICDKDGMPKYPILLVTARMDLVGVFKGLYVDGVLIKPFDSVRLINEVANIVLAQEQKRKEQSIKKIVIIDQDQASCKDIANLLTTKGFATQIAHSGEIGVEMITQDPPDLAVVNLGLTDIPGDMVILGLQQVIKSRKTKYILFSHKNYEHNQIIMEKFAGKTGVKLVCEYSSPSELLYAINIMLSEPELPQDS